MVKLIHVEDEKTLNEYNNAVMNGKAMVLYYMQGCGACEAMKPEWEKFEDELSKEKYNSYDVLVARVRSDYLNDVKCDHSGLIGFPTILELSNGQKVSEYEGKRTKEGFIGFFEEISKSMSGGGRKTKRNKKSRRNNRRSKRNKISRSNRRTKHNRKSRHNRRTKHNRKH
jgi:thiol-disulfide isomerase/thioredoxin